jgi:hypothetical protein
MSSEKAEIPPMITSAVVSTGLSPRSEGVMETVPKGPATREIKALWEFLNKGATAKPKRRAAKMVERAAR